MFALPRYDPRGWASPRGPAPGPRGTMSSGCLPAFFHDPDRNELYLAEPASAGWRP
jgi:hypothetical protein